MGIGYQVKKYQEQKAAAAAAAGEDTVQDPKNYMPRPDEDEADEKKVTQSSVLLQIAAMQAETARLIADMRTSMASGSTSDGSIALIERMLAQQEQLVNKTRPENPQSPGISVYSYPEGDLARPKPELRCKMTWVGYELVTDTLTPREVELLNQLQPGEFRVTKADGTRIPFKVSAKFSDQYDESTGRFKVERQDISFPCKGDHRQNHMSMIAYLQQVLHGAVPTAEELLTQIAALKAELASAKTGLVGVVA